MFWMHPAINDHCMIILHKCPPVFEVYKFFYAIVCSFYLLKVIRFDKFIYELQLLTNNVRAEDEYFAM